jgi:hypothetical protein
MQEDFMNTFGVLLLAAATATTGIGKPHSFKNLLRHDVVADGPAPPGGVGGCHFGHPGCQGGQSCPGAGGRQAQPGRRFPNVRSQINFVEPRGMKIGWQTSTGNGEKVYLPAQLAVPARYNFLQGYIYRLKLTDIPGRPNLALYPTIEVAPSTPATDAYLSHNPIPAQFTEEDFDQVTAGNFVTKVVYLPDPKYQELAISGVETLVSTRLEPGIDPILEADRRGTILMIVRLGGINLEMPAGGGMGPAYDMSQPGSVPGHMAPGGPGMVESTPVDNAPVSPVVPGAGPFTPAPGAGPEGTPQPPTPAPTIPTPPNY